MSTGSIVAISVVGGVVLLMLLLKSVSASVRGSLDQLVQEKFAGQDILAATTGANCFGVKSKGARQIRGNGALVLTKDVLYFVRALPRKEYVIPVETISDITTPKWFLGKSVFSRLLCVHFAADHGEDEIAWAVGDLAAWVDAISRLRSRTE